MNVPVNIGYVNINHHIPEAQTMAEKSEIFLIRPKRCHASVNPTKKVDDPKNRTYQPKLSPKWISEDGKKMVLIWSDAMKNKEGCSHTVNYKWNHMEITIQTK